MKLWDWQEADQARLAELGDVALLNMEPGAGKTVTAAASLARTEPERVLIIAPQATHLTAWEPTIRALTGRDARIVGNGNKRTKEALTDLEWGSEGVFLCTPQFFTRAANDQWAGDFIVVDEVHQLTKPGSKGQKALSGYNTDDLALGSMFAHRLALSGTPLRNKFENAWSIARFLWPEMYERGQVAHINHWLWCADRMTRQEIVVGRDETGKLRTANKWLTEREPGRWINECPGVIQHFRRRKCCEFHPNGFLPTDEPQTLKRVIDLAPRQKKAIKEMERHFMTWLDGNPLVAELTLTQQQRIRQMCLGVPTVTWTVDEAGAEHHSVTFDPDCESPFFDELLSIIESLDEGEPVAVYLESQKFARVVTDRLNSVGVRAFEFSGKVPTRERSENLRNFGTPEGHQVVVGVISSIGTGTDGIQKVCSTEVWLERSADPTLNEQTEARTDRMGAKAQTQRYFLQDEFGYAEGRVSQQIEARLKLRQSTTRREG